MYKCVCHNCVVIEHPTLLHKYLTQAHQQQQQNAPQHLSPSRSPRSNCISHHNDKTDLNTINPTDIIAMTKLQDEAAYSLQKPKLKRNMRNVRHFIDRYTNPCQRTRVFSHPMPPIQGRPVLHLRVDNDLRPLTARTSQDALQRTAKHVLQYTQHMKE
eukprot:PhF_6_TR19178/c0_g1_i2/m.28206